MLRQVFTLALILVVFNCQAAPITHKALTGRTAETRVAKPGMTLTPSVGATDSTKLQGDIARLQLLIAAMPAINNARHESAKKIIHNLS